MQEENNYLIAVKKKYAKSIGLVALFISIFALAGIVGTIIVYWQGKADNHKVNISGRQRFLSAKILIDLERHIENKNNLEIKKAIENERIMFREGLEFLGFHESRIIPHVNKSKFAAEMTPAEVDIYKETINYLTATSLDVGRIEERIPGIKTSQNQVIGPVWDTSTAMLADHNDQLYFKLMIFVVFCFALVILLNIYSITRIVLPLLREIRQTLLASEEVKKENAENKNLLKVSSKFVTLGEQVANINHDMNNMLTLISAFIPSFKELIANQPEQLRRFAIMEKSVERLIALTTALRRSIIGSQHMIAENFNILDILKDCNTILSDKLKHHRVKLQLNVESNLTITIRKDYLYQFLLNLIANAIEAVSSTDNAWIKIEAEVINHEIRIRVIDSGIGLPPEVQEKLFKPFYTTKEHGSGLGLSYMKKMAEEIGGELFYEEYSGHTCFTLKLPQP